MRILELLTEKRLRGNLGERAAARFLRKKGYRIVGRNCVIEGVGEIDLVAAKRGLTVIVEVKTRKVGTLREGERPAMAVTREKQRRLLLAGSVYKGRHRRDTRLRYDVVEVYTDIHGKKERVVDIKHLESAFDGSASKGPRGKRFTVL